VSCEIKYDHETHKYHDKDTSVIQTVDFHAWFDSPEEAKAFVATLPKYLKLKTWATSKAVAFRVKFISNGVTGDENEAGIKRVRKFLDLCDIEPTPSMKIINQASLDDLRKFVGMEVTADA
jgi:hypothetical protein